MQGHTPVALHHAAVGCENRTAGVFCLSSCHNSPLVRHFTHGFLLCENLLRQVLVALRLSINSMGWLRTLGRFVGNGLDRSVQLNQ